MAVNSLKLVGDVLQSAPEAMLVIDCGKIAYANTQITVAFGYSSAELKGQPLHLLIPSMEHSTGADSSHAWLATPGLGVFRAPDAVLGQRKDGTTFAIEMTMSQITMRRKSFVMGVVRDVTDRKALEGILESVRIQMIASARLSSLGAMAGGIAHEINNPLAVIHALASDLAEQETISRDETVSWAAQIVGHAERILKIVVSMRHLSRDGAQDPFTTTAVTSIVAQTLDLCEERFRTNSVTLYAPSIDPALRIACREVQISQILGNLLLNAFDAVIGKVGERWVRLEVGVEGPDLVFSVIDSGGGVPEALRARIMEPFFTTKPIGRGTGLGLSLSKRFASDHGGSLRLDEKSLNTCFSLSLPLVQAGHLQ